MAVVSLLVRMRYVAKEKMVLADRISMLMRIIVTSSLMSGDNAPKTVSTARQSCKDNVMHPMVFTMLSRRVMYATDRTTISASMMLFIVV